MTTHAATPEGVDDFIARWSGQRGGSERANYQMFLSELCDVLEVPRPDPASDNTATNDYVFERAVREIGREGAISNRRIDLYKRGCFILEAKQSRQGDSPKALQTDLFGPTTHIVAERRSRADKNWDVLMQNARRQAEDYVRLLPREHASPPFVIVCDVGVCLELYSNFRGDGRAYDQFPDRRRFRIYLEDLREPGTREMLAQLFDRDRVHDLDPTRRSARVTREIAQRLAAVSKALEAERHPPEQVAAFLSRCLFTMFAEDVKLLPEKSFRDVLQRCVVEPGKFKPFLEQLWAAMDTGDFAYAIEQKVPRFNGQFFKDRTAFALGAEEIGELKRAADYNWDDVEPAIFGTLLEQALDPVERRQLGAHYTPRAYVERLVMATVIDPLRQDWEAALATAERQKAEKRDNEAAATLRAFHHRLCDTRVLDPACGTGNFLYVALELMKRLEGEVQEALADLGETLSLDKTVDPHQFLGIELNPRAAAIAETVLWIGFLQWHFRNNSARPAEPILRAFRNIECRDAMLTWDGAPVPAVVTDPTGGRVEAYPNPRRPAWPEAEFIVGNPPFIGGKDLRARLGDGYTEALWAAHPKMNDSADFVMYWWDRAAEILTAKDSVLRRFGLVTTNSISQVFQRRVVERHLSGRAPLSLVMAIPDHPWTKAAPEAAAVRIAMTVAQAGEGDGVLREVLREAALDTDTPVIELCEAFGRINPDLTVGVDLGAASALLANEGMSARGMVLHGAGFIVTPAQAEYLGRLHRKGLDKHIRHYRNGRDLTDRPRGVLVIDLFGLTADEVRERFPEVYQHVKMEVKEKINIGKDGEKQLVGRDWNNRQYRRENWWLFGENIPELRKALEGLRRYIATVETTKHRVFQFLDAAILPDNMLVAIGSDDAFHLGVLSSRIHGGWAIRAGGWLGMGNDPRYSKSRCFDPFPFPAATDAQKESIRTVAEALDAHRKRVLAEHPHLTLTGLYNVREKLRAGIAPDALDAADRRTFDDGLLLILNEYHDTLDAAVAAAYGWAADLSDEAILQNLVALNRERAAQEARGQVQWLRPDYQQPRFGRGAAAPVQGEADFGEDAPDTTRPRFPTGDDRAETAIVMQVLAGTHSPLTETALAARFAQGQKVLERVRAVLRALARMGIVVHDRDRGFTLRRPGTAPTR
jgi:SAM-dependent methyltransferase